MPMIYKICPEPLWQDAEAKGVLSGMPIDVADGYIHFSTGSQLAETLRLHFAGMDGLVVAAIDAEKLDGDLRYEKSRGGALFPHLYGPLPMSAIAWVEPLVLDRDGRHVIPDAVR